MSIFNNKSILAWLQYFSENTDIDLATVRILDITGSARNLMPAVHANPSVLVFTDGNHRGVNVSAAMLINNPHAHSAYRIGLDNSSFSPGTIRYVDPEIRAVILKKLNLDENETICCVSGESIAVEAAIAVKRGNVVAVEYKPGDFQTMEENLVRFGLRNVLIVDDMESYSHRWPVPDVAFLVASPKLETELKTLVHVNPKIRVVIYTLEFSFMSRIPGMLWDNGIKPTEVMKLEVSKLGRKDEIEVQPAPWIFSGQAGLDEA